MFFSAKLCQALPETFADSKLLRPQMLLISHYIHGVRLYDNKQSPSRFHTKVTALVGGKTATFVIIHLCVFGSFVSRARDACYNYLSCSLRNNFLFSCAVQDLLMCNVVPYNSMQDIKIVVHREL